MTSSYIKKVDAMFDQADLEVRAIAKQFMVNVLGDVIVATPGPGNQYAGTLYIAQGDLRGGWTWDDTPPPATASRWGGGPRDDTGAETKARIAAKIFSGPLPRHAWAWNEMAYAWYVHEGKENHEHIGPRPFADPDLLDLNGHLTSARRTVMGRFGI